MLPQGRAIHLTQCCRRLRVLVRRFQTACYASRGRVGDESLKTLSRCVVLRSAFITNGHYEVHDAAVLGSLPNLTSLDVSDQALVWR